MLMPIIFYALKDITYKTLIMKTKKTYIVCCILFLLVPFQYAKGQGILKKIINKTEKKIEKKTDDLLDSVFDETDEENLDSINTSEDNTIHKQVPIDNPKMFDVNEKKLGFEHYSKFDFIPGNEVVFFEDFQNAQIGDIPVGWSFSGNTEVVHLSHLQGKWLKISNGKSTLVPPINYLPENFTFEFDLVFDFEPSKFTYARYLYAVFSDHENPNSDLSKVNVGKNSFIFSYTGGANGRGLSYIKKAKNSTYNDKQLKSHPYTDAKNNSKRGEVIKVSIWKTNTRMRVYLDEQKVYDVPRAFEEDVKLSTLRFCTEFSAENEYYFIGNLRVAESENTIPQILSNQGMYSSQGIYFDSGSAKIKPESYATLKQIAAFIQANGSSFFIAGHTDNVGDNEENRILSQERSSAVREALVSDFDVDTNLLASGGYGSKYPISSNSTSQGKAQNRRVDFINLSVKSSQDYENELYQLSKTNPY